MGERGPAPKPTKLKRFEGNPGKRKLPTDEPEPTAGAPDAPEWLLPEARDEWDRVVPELERMGLVTVVDGTALAGYCQAVARLQQAERELAEHGSLTYTTDKGNIIQHPAVGISNTALATIRAFCKEFGFTPSARSRMSVGGEAGEDDPLLSLPGLKVV